MKQAFERFSSGAAPASTRDPEADKPTLVHTPVELLEDERSPRTIARGAVDESLLELESALDGSGLDELPVGDRPSGNALAGIDERTEVGTRPSFDSLEQFDDEWCPEPKTDEPSYIGQVLDNRYVVEALIARGGMGIVYRCRHQVIGKKFAVKIIRSNMARLPDAPRRFLMEAKAASAIGNEHIIDIVDYGTLADGSSYLVMELLEGMALSDVIARHETLPTPRIVAIALQVCEGLRAAHEAGIVHRDLKPENIFLCNRRSGDFVKILDFGIAKMSLLGEPMTKKGLIVGTPHYMSPEQAAGMPVDPRGDIYSLGVILYELATGRVPFDATHYMAVLAKHMTAAPPPFDTLRLIAKIPPEFETIVLTCLAKRAEQRFQTVTELLESFERLSRQLEAPAVGDAPLSRERAPSVDLISGVPLAPGPDRGTGSSLPAAAGRNVTVHPRRRDLGLAALTGLILSISAVSVWRMQSDDPPGELADESHDAHTTTAPLEPGDMSPGARASAPRDLAPLPLPPAPAPAPPAPADLAAPGELLAASDQTPLTVVQLAPGKSVEIESRTRLSLRLDPEPPGDARSSTSEAPPSTSEARSSTRTSSVPRKAAEARARALARAAAAREEQAAKETGLMNPWPATH